MVYTYIVSCKYNNLYFSFVINNDVETVLFYRHTFTFYSVGISAFATMLPEILEILGSQPKYGGDYKVNYFLQSNLNA